MLLVRKKLTCKNLYSETSFWLPSVEHVSKTALCVFDSGQMKPGSIYVYRMVEFHFKHSGFLL